ncbi:MAG: thioredoxin domain-containing protein [Methanomicrobiaceae archaeon]|nr:thioredoxin domain-containing protein [Methanomicrobiaceae archaeon]
MAAQQHMNRLAREKSPYLLQHAANPVDWYPWGEEAFKRARAEEKPVFLSIGYSTCHWCHVMAHESFENDEVASLLNEHFIPIKVDREERPDIDHVYMTVCQVLSKRCGWPLTIVTTPTMRPFFAASYIPRESRFGIAGLMDILPRIISVWEEQRDEVEHSAKRITGVIGGIGPPAGDVMPGEAQLQATYDELRAQYDDEFGGFGSAPKFPTPHNLLFLLRWWRRSGDPAALGMVERTLRAIRNGGVFDQVGFGVHRYAVDREWLVPHFEKMLYDQALLAYACVETYQATGDPFFRQVAEDLFAYVLRALRDPDGALYSAEDADSEGVEGRFYLWTEPEIRDILSGEDADIAIYAFNVLRGGNFAQESTGMRSGANILHMTEQLPDIAARFGLGEDEIAARMERIRTILFSARERRVPPGKDDKILADWNGLMIAALAKAGAAFGDERLLAAARDAASFLMENLSSGDTALRHRYRDGVGGVPGTLDDYASLVWGLIELYLATADSAFLERAVAFNEHILMHFRDEGGGGFFFVADDAEELIVRPKEIYDGAIPSGNAVCMLNLLRLARLTGRSDLEERASVLAKTFAPAVSRTPSAHAFFACALDFALGPSYEVVVAGSRGAADTEALLALLRTAYLPSAVWLTVDPGNEGGDVIGLAPFAAGMEMQEGHATAHICREHTCLRPVSDPADLYSLLIGAPESFPAGKQ